jgi:hypothetical protein
MAATQHECLLALLQRVTTAGESPTHESLVRVRRLMDGTTRRTLATSSSSISRSSSLPFLLERSPNWPLVCRAWQSAANIVQATTAKTVQALARQVSLWDTEAPIPLLTTLTASSNNDDQQQDNSPPTSDTMQQVIAQGDYLQHFHSYETQPVNDSPNAIDNHSWTIDWHVDQGMLLAFTPGWWMTISTSDTLPTTSTTSSRSTSTGIPSSPPRSELYIQDGWGSVLAVHLDPAVDNVVLMLGDGWHQVSRTSTFHAVPHALQLTSPTTRATASTATVTTATAAAKARVWFGLMVLPPAQVIHPQSLLDHDKQPVTFGEIRQRLMQNGRSHNENDNLLDLACSRNTYQAREVRSFPVAPTVSSRHRWLATADNDVDASMCNNETQLYCWRTCQNLTVETSHHGCDETLRQLACVSNETGLIWSGTTNGAQYQPQCVDHGTAVEAVTTTTTAADDTATATPPTASSVVGTSAGSGSATSASWRTTVGFLVPVCMVLWTAMGGEW